MNDFQVMDDYLFIAVGNVIKKFNLNLYLSPTQYFRFHTKDECEAQMKSNNLKDLDKESLLKFVCSFGLVEPAKFLLRQFSELKFNTSGDSAMFSALKNKRWSLLEDLTNKKKDFQDQTKVNPEHREVISLLQRKATHDDVVYLRGLYESKFDFIDIEVDILSAFFLSNSTRPTQIKFLQYWLNYISDSRGALKDQYGRRPLHYSMLFGSLVGTRMLMERDSNTHINDPDNDGFTPLHLGLQQSANPLSPIRGNRSIIQLMESRYVKI